MEHRPQSPGRGLEEREEELHRPAMVEWIPVEGALMKARGGKTVWLDLNPHLFYGQLVQTARGVIEKKLPGFSHSFDTWKMVIIGHRS